MRWTEPGALLSSLEPFATYGLGSMEEGLFATIQRSVRQGTAFVSLVVQRTGFQPIGFSYSQASLEAEGAVTALDAVAVLLRASAREPRWRLELGGLSSEEVWAAYALRVLAERAP